MTKTIYAAAFGVGSFFALNCGSGDGVYPAPADETSAARGAQQSSDPNAAGVVEIKISGHTFDPPEVRIKANQTVRWVWASGRHNVVSGTGCAPDGKFTSEVVGPPSTFERSFDATGTYPYYCDPHCGMGMTGKIIVE